MSYNSKYTGVEVEAKLDIIGRIPVIEHGTADTDIELTPNVLHKWDEVTSLVLTFPTDEEGVRSEYKVVFIAGEAFSLSVPLTMRWANDDIPVFEAGKQYEMSIFDRRILVSAFSNPIIDGDFLEYIENDGVDYILTDYVMSNADYGIRFKCAPLFDSSSTYSIAAGARNGSTVADSPLMVWYQTKCRVDWNGIKGDEYDYVSGSVREFTVTGTQNTIIQQHPLAIFGGIISGSISYVNKFRFFYLDILDKEDNPRLSLRPFHRAADGATGLIDQVSGTFYPSVNGNLIGA